MIAFRDFVAIFLAFDLLAHLFTIFEQPYGGAVAVMLNMTVTRTNDYGVVTWILTIVNWLAAWVIKLYANYNLSYDLWLLVLFFAYVFVLRGHLGSYIIATTLVCLQADREAWAKLIFYVFLLTAVTFRATIDMVLGMVGLPNVHSILFRVILPYSLFPLYHYFVILPLSIIYKSPGKMATLASAIFTKIRRWAAYRLILAAVYIDPSLGKPDPAGKVQPGIQSEPGLEPESVRESQLKSEPEPEPKEEERPAPTLEISDVIVTADTRPEIPPYLAELLRNQASRAITTRPSPFRPYNRHHQRAYYLTNRQNEHGQPEGSASTAADTAAPSSATLEPTQDPTLEPNSAPVPETEAKSESGPASKPTPDPEIIPEPEHTCETAHESTSEPTPGSDPEQEAVPQSVIVPEAENVPESETALKLELAPKPETNSARVPAPTPDSEHESAPEPASELTPSQKTALDAASQILPATMEMVPVTTTVPTNTDPAASARAVRDISTRPHRSQARPPSEIELKQEKLRQQLKKESPASISHDSNPIHPIDSVTLVSSDSRHIPSQVIPVAAENVPIKLTQSRAELKREFMEEVIMKEINKQQRKERQQKLLAQQGALSSTTYSTNATASSSSVPITHVRGTIPTTTIEIVTFTIPISWTVPPSPRPLPRLRLPGPFSPRQNWARRTPFRRRIAKLMREDRMCPFREKILLKDLPRLEKEWNLRQEEKLLAPITVAIEPLSFPVAAKPVPASEAAPTTIPEPAPAVNAETIPTSPRPNQELQEIHMAQFREKVLLEELKRQKEKLQQQQEMEQKLEQQKELERQHLEQLEQQQREQLEEQVEKQQREQLEQQQQREQVQQLEQLQHAQQLQQQQEQQHQALASPTVAAPFYPVVPDTPMAPTVQPGPHEIAPSVMSETSHPEAVQGTPATIPSTIPSAEDIYNGKVNMDAVLLDIEDFLVAHPYHNYDPIPGFEDIPFTATEGLLDITTEAVASAAVPATATEAVSLETVDVDAVRTETAEPIETFPAEASETMPSTTLESIPTATTQTVVAQNPVPETVPFMTAASSFTFGVGDAPAFPFASAATAVTDAAAIIPETEEPGQEEFMVKDEFDSKPESGPEPEWELNPDEAALAQALMEALDSDSDSDSDADTDSDIEQGQNRELIPQYVRIFEEPPPVDESGDESDTPPPSINIPFEQRAILRPRSIRSRLAAGQQERQTLRPRSIRGRMDALATQEATHSGPSSFPSAVSNPEQQSMYTEAATTMPGIQQEMVVTEQQQQVPPVPVEMEAGPPQEPRQQQEDHTPQPTTTPPPPSQPQQSPEQSEINHLRDIRNINPAFLLSPPKPKTYHIQTSPNQISPSTPKPKTDSTKKPITEMERNRHMKMRQDWKAQNSNPFMPKKKPTPKKD